MSGQLTKVCVRDVLRQGISYQCLKSQGHIHLLCAPHIFLSWRPPLLMNADHAVTGRAFDARACDVVFDQPHDVVEHRDDGAINTMLALYLSPANQWMMTRAEVQHLRALYNTDIPPGSRKRH
jgi:hypothetical protein